MYSFYIKYQISYVIYNSFFCKYSLGVHLQVPLEKIQILHSGIYSPKTVQGCILNLKFIFPPNFWFIYFPQMKVSIRRGCAPQVKYVQPFLFCHFENVKSIGEKICKGGGANRKIYTPAKTSRTSSRWNATRNVKRKFNMDYSDIPFLTSNS